MPNTIGTAYIQIEPSAQGIGGKIADVINPEATKVGQSAGGKLAGALGSALKMGGGLVAGIGTAFAGATVAITNAAKSTAEYGDNIDKMSQKLGVSSEFYQEWDAVLQHSGTSMDSMGASFKKLAVESQNATDGQKAAFESLGLSMEQVQSMNAEQLFASVVSGLQGMEEGTERTAIATELLGKGAMELGPLLNTSAEDTQAMIDAVHDLGGVMSDEAVKNSAAFQDSLQNMQTAFDGVKNQLISDFLPNITDVMDGLGKLAAGDDSGLGLIKEGIDGFLQNMSDAIPKIITVAIDILSSLADTITDHLPEIVEMGIELIIKLIAGLVKALPKLIAKVPDIIKAVVTGLKNAWPELKSAGGDMVEGLWNGIKSMWGSLKQRVTSLASSLIDSIKGFFKIGSPSKLFRDEIGQWIPAGIAVGIDSNLGTLDDSMSNIQSALSPDQLDVASNYAVNYDSTSANNTDALFDLLSQYLPQIANMQVVMDTGATVGVLANPMNSALGKIASRGANR